VKLLSFLVLLLTGPALYAQVDSAALSRTYYRAAHLSDADSIKYYADSISHLHPAVGNDDIHIMVLRLYGWYYENKGDFTNALNYYYRGLDSARKHNLIHRQTELLTDLAAVYTSDVKQPFKAKEIYQECVRLNTRLGDAHLLIANYANLGAIYNSLKLYDSALFFLNEGLRIGKPLEGKNGEYLFEIYNNLGNSCYFLKQYDESIRWFRINYNNDLKSQDPDHLANLWFDALNMADSYTQKAQYDSAAKYGELSLQLARRLESRSKQADSYQILAALAQHRGDYHKAWEYQRNWYSLDTALVNAETYKSIAELEQKYEARKKENERLLLQAALDQQKFHNQIMMILMGFLLMIAIAIAILFIIKRRANRQLQSTNELIVRQNERLSELNHEKNSLISIVSHDLSTPFASIGMWQQLLQNEQENLTNSQKKALDRIGQATKYGENLIRHILDVEKAQTNQHKMQLENLDLRIFAETIIDEFGAAAAKKDIRLHLDCPDRAVYFLSDRQLLARMLENLLSNAIKYTSKGRNVFLSVSEEKDAVSIMIRDEGVGIQPDELPHLFSKYSKISSRPTNGETSTGLGLAIVKRICEELNGQISCESAPGKGSVFTVVLKK
jgi:signal transduction histidine kinase